MRQVFPEILNSKLVLEILKLAHQFFTEGIIKKIHSYIMLGTSALGIQVCKGGSFLAAQEFGSNLDLRVLFPLRNRHLGSRKPSFGPNLKSPKIRLSKTRGVPT